MLNLLFSRFPVFDYTFYAWKEENLLHKQIFTDAIFIAK